MTDSIENDIKAALDEMNKVDTAPADTPSDAPVDDQPVDTPEADTPPPEAKPADPIEPPPVSLSAAAKEKWKDLPPEVRQEWKKREEDIHRAMTAHDGELSVGRKIKEIAQPYEAIIRAEGGTVEGAFRDLLNTAYVLRTGSPQQKAQLLIETAKQFGVDLAAYQAAPVDPVAALRQEIESIKSQANPDVIKNQLQEQMQFDKVKSEIEAFAANPQNVHFQAVRTKMGALMTSGQAKDLQEAYEMAIWADPSIRPTLLNAQKEQEAAKKKAEMEAKKKAAASVNGSPTTATPSANAPQKSIEDELREQLRLSRGVI